MNGCEEIICDVCDPMASEKKHTSHTNNVTDTDITGVRERLLGSRYQFWKHWIVVLVVICTVVLSRNIWFPVKHKSINSVKESQTKDVKSQFEDIYWRLNEGDYERAAVHLIGTYSRNTGIITWYNVAASSSLRLTANSFKLKVGASGNYFMYTRIQYNNQTSTDPPFRIFQECLNGVREISFHTSRIQRGQQVVEFSMERVVYLNKGDNLFVDIPSEEQINVSYAANAHVMGLFEI